MSEQHFSNTVDRATEALYHGAGLALRTKEIGSQNVVEKMNHRDEVYNLAGEAALRGDIVDAREQTANEGSVVNFMIERMAIASEKHSEAIDSLQERRDKRSTGNVPTTPFLDKRIQASKDKKSAKHEERLREQEFKEARKQYRKFDASATRSGGLRNWVGRRIDNQQLRRQLRDGVIDRPTFDTERATMRINPDYNWHHAASVKNKAEKSTKETKKKNREAQLRTPVLSTIRSGVVKSKELYEEHRDKTAERDVKKTRKRLERRAAQPIASRFRGVRRSASERVVNFTKDKAEYYKGEYRHLRRKRLEH